MSQFQNGWQKASKALKAEGNGGSANEESRKHSEQENEDATMKAAGKVAEAGGYRLSYEQKKRASPFVHYGFGTAMGAVYGVLREVAPKSVRRMHPVVAGARLWGALFVGADEIAVPAFGLSGSPKETPVSAHVDGFASHAVYGLTGEMVLRTVRNYL